MPSPDVSSGNDSTDRRATRRKPLSIRLYFDPLYTEFARFIGYEGKPLGDAEQFVLKLAKTYGEDKVIEASEVLSVCDGTADAMTVRLTAQARRLAWQLLGPPPEHGPTDLVTGTP